MEPTVAQVGQEKKEQVNVSETDDTDFIDGMLTDIHEKEELRMEPSMEKPLPFINSNSSGKFELNPKVVDILNNVNKPVSVVAIVGKYRTGKSFLMNRLYGKKAGLKNKGFPLGSTIEAKTKGIWLWARPHPDDPDQCLLLLDTEGLYDTTKGDETHDLQLFSLALLLSSCLVFNVIGTIDDVLVTQLHLVSELTNHIRTGRSPHSTDGNEEDFGRYFPHFVLVLRDFFLALEIKGKKCTTDDYLEHSLALKPGTSKQIKKYNAPRENLREYFPHRRCFALPKPIEDDVKMRMLEKVSVFELKKEFRDKADEAIAGIIQEAGTFKIKTDVITGARFVSLARMYVEAINSGGVPDIESSVELLRNTECQQALELALKEYTKCMQTRAVPSMPLSTQELSDFHQIAAKEALDVYQGRALFDEERTYVNKFMDGIQEAYERLLQENDGKSEKRCRELLEQHFAELNRKVKDSHYTSKGGGYTQYVTDKQTAVAEYQKEPKKGPLEESVLNEYLKSKETEDTAILNADKALSETERQLAEETIRREMEEQAVRAQQEQNAQLQCKLEDEHRQNQEVLKQTRLDFEARISEQKRQQDDLIAKKAQEMEKLQKENNDKAREFEAALQKMRDDRAALDNNASAMRQEIIEAEKRYIDLEGQLRQNQANSAAQIKALQDQINALRNQRRGGRKKGCVIS